MLYCIPQYHFLFTGWLTGAYLIFFNSWSQWVNGAVSLFTGNVGVTGLMIILCLHSISHQTIKTVAVNPSGEWLAFGCSNLGQLLVWEWQSETYILKQQGHYYDMNTLCYSQDAHYVATGGDDGKVSTHFLHDASQNILK